MIKPIVVGATILALTGCASESELRMAYDAQVRVAEVQAQQKGVEQSTLSINCTTGCEGLSVSYIDPRDRSNFAIPRVTNTNDVVVRTLPAGLSAVKWIAGFWAGTQIVDSVMDSTSGTVVSNAVSGENNSMMLDSSVKEIEVGDINIPEEVEVNE